MRKRGTDLSRPETPRETPEQMAAASEQRKRDRNKAINQAIAAVLEIPFHSWPNQELRGIAVEMVECLRYDYDDPRQLEQIASAAVRLSGQVQDRTARFAAETRHIAQRVEMELSGLMRDEPADVTDSLWKSIKELERRRMGGSV